MKKRTGALALVIASSTAAAQVAEINDPALARAGTDWSRRIHSYETVNSPCSVGVGVDESGEITSLQLADCKPHDRAIAAYAVLRAGRPNLPFNERKFGVTLVPKHMLEDD
ncbi:MAG TPA: hypothetical protein VGE57_13835 [Solimonas sp.]